MVFPFPSTDHPETIKSNYRSDMVSQAGVVIFVFGNKLEEIEVREADGMWKEFEIARELGKKIIQLIGHKDHKYKRVPGAGVLYRWTWNNLKKILD